jgi:hypothetical protein
MHKYLLIAALILATGISCIRNTGRNADDKNVASITVKNTLEIPRTDALVEINVNDLLKVVKQKSVDSFVLVYDTIHPFQLNDDDGDGKADRLLFVCNLGAGESKVFNFIKTGKYGEYKFKKRTQAELSVKTGGSWQENKYIGGSFMNIDYLKVPPEHTDHSFYIRYEGPGWESDRVGYRFYLDWRNAADIFGKRVDTMVLQNVGQDGFESYHEPAPWGMDILKVGNSLGIGTLGTWYDGKAHRVAETDSITCEILQNGPLQSAIKTIYYGWQAGDVKTDLVSVLSIHAGSRMTRHKVSLTAAIDNICTGIVRHELAEVVQSDSAAGEWTCFATWGKQSLSDDNLGMAVFYRKGDLIELTGDEESHVIVLRPAGNELEYYFAAAWEHEKGGIKSLEEFKQYLETEVSMLNNPLDVKCSAGRSSGK